MHIAQFRSINTHALALTTVIYDIYLLVPKADDTRAGNRQMTDANFR